MEGYSPIRMDIEKLDRLAQDRNYWRAFLNAALRVRVS